MHPRPRHWTAGWRTASATLLALALSVPASLTARADDTVTIPDQALRACISAELAAEHLDTGLTPANLAKLQQLLCTSGVADLTGVEALSGLTKLQVFPSWVRDISPVAGLSSLEVLALPSSQPYDLAPLAGLPRLAKLAVSIHGGTDVAPVARLSGLEFLALELRGLSRLPELAVPASVENLSVSGDGTMTSLGRIGGGAGVTRLSIYGSRVLSSLEGIEGLTGVLDLYAPFLGVSDISAVAGMKQLTKLDLRQNSVTELSPLAGLTHLQSLNLSENRVTSVRHLAGLTELTELRLYRDTIRDVSPLATLARLETLDITDNQIADLSPLAGLPALSTLHAGGNRLANLGPSAGLSHLTWAGFDGNRLTSIEGLRGARLSFIDLSRNELSDIGPLAALSSGAEVRLSFNHVRDLSALPDSVKLTASDQSLTYPMATVGVPFDLGIRGVGGAPVCPMSRPASRCTDGRITYPASGTYSLWIASANDGFSLYSSQHAGPDRTFTRTFTPELFGRPTVGMAVGVTTRDWLPKPERYTYSWYRDGKLIAGTDPVRHYYEATAADLGHRLKGCMTGHLDGYVPKTVCTAPSAKVVRGQILVASKPRITGTAVVGAKLTAHPRTWDAQVTLHYQWQRDGKNITGATSRTYTIRPRDVGHSIRVRVKGTAPGRESRSEYSKAVRPKLR